jgi:hypothetical protein
LRRQPRSLKVEPIIAHVHGDVEIEAAINALGREPGGGLVVMPDNFTGFHSAAIISAAARNNVPAVYPNSFQVREGGLLSYGPDPVDLFRRRGAAICSLSVLRAFKHHAFLEGAGTASEQLSLRWFSTIRARAGLRAHARSELLGGLALRHAVPAIYQYPEFTAAA